MALVTLSGCDEYTSKKQSAAKKYKQPEQVKSQSYSQPAIYTFLYGLNGYKFADLMGKYSPKVAVVDVDDAQLTSAEVKKLRAAGKIIFSYLSIGEAENYRDYWQGWDKNKPTFLLDENKDWHGNYRVKFWDKDWQNIIITKVAKIAQMGFNGVYLDIIDGYQEKSVIRAYSGSKDNLRREMENFVIRISSYAKQINPSFKIIPQNAVELAADAENDTRPNVNYLRAIDGMGVEDLWYDDNDKSDWTNDDLAYINLAKSYGKFILATSYPSDANKRTKFINNALKAGFIPFAGKRELSKKEGVYPINKQLVKAIPSSWINSLR